MAVYAVASVKVAGLFVVNTNAIATMHSRVIQFSTPLHHCMLGRSLDFELIPEGVENMRFITHPKKPK